MSGNDGGGERRRRHGGDDDGDDAGGGGTAAKVAKQTRWQIYTCLSGLIGFAAALPELILCVTVNSFTGSNFAKQIAK